MAEKKFKKHQENPSSGSAAVSPAVKGEAPPEQLVRLLGRLERCDNNGIAGWIAVKDISQPLSVELLIDDQVVSTMVANLFRQELSDAGIGEGRHGFVFPLPALLRDGQPHVIAVREVSKGILLPGSPKTVVAKHPTAVAKPKDAPAGKFPTIGKEGQVLEPGILLDQMIGPICHGWSLPVADDAGYLRLHFGSITLGKVISNNPRPDVRQHLGLNNDELGFQVMIGGLLQFSALTESLRTAALIQASTHGTALSLDLPSYFDQAYTFSPLKSFSRHSRHLGRMSSATCAPTGAFTLLLEAGTAEGEPDHAIKISFYQEKEGGVLTRLAQFDIALNGQLARLQCGLWSTEKPVLLVVTNSAYEILLTDCIPYPAMYFEKYAALMEYHSLLANGQSAFDVIAKISRSYLDHETDKRTGALPPSSMPTRETTTVLLFCSGDTDIEAQHAITAYAHVASNCAFVRRDGTVLEASGQVKTSLSDFLRDATAGHYLLCEAGSVLRPDFWSIYSATAPDETTDLLYWESIWLDGANRPLWVKNEALSGEGFRDEELVPLGAALFSSRLVAELGSERLAALAKGTVQLHNLISTIKRERIRRLPVVMDIRRLALMPTMIQRMHTHQQEFPSVLPAAHRVQSAPRGVSVIINFRNAAPVTIECLKSVSLQRFDGPIEIILVDNGSTSNESAAIHSAAEALFGKENVVQIKYAGQFNHSKQCNLASQQARHDFLLMLSNDSILISRDAIERGVRIAGTHNVATCGFRIVKAHGDSQKFVSLGLALSSNKYLFAGAAPLSSHRPPNSLLPYTQGCHGNTFAAVMLRKSVYEQLHGLDENEFPTDYNDVDFCLRATSAGYSHVAIGGALVSHNGRGSREMNLDLPVNPTLIARMPSLATILQSFSVRAL